MITAEAIHKSKRVAGNVIRYHTWPTITNQTVADHTYHVMRIYHELFGHSIHFDWDYEIFDTILRHDMGEQMVGDLPYPIKKNDPVLAARVSFWEFIAQREQGWDSGVDLDPDTGTAIKICDLLEMAEYARYESNLGNEYAQVVFSRVVDHVYSMNEFWGRYPLIKEAMTKLVKEMT